MKIKLNKLKAFTLSEMIVVLLITTIVVGMAFSVLQLVQRQMKGIQGNFEKSTELNLLRQSLWIDFNTHDQVFYDSMLKQLIFVNEMERLHYEIGESAIIKGRDTFQVKWHRQKFYFENKERLFGEIDAIDFELDQEYGHRKLFVYKNNAATTYLNN
ncbi:prepilin-type N-terminal cleavage/methylation domain-containing protein [Arenibacter sp. M-2]|uniref:PulJ/GspJ family protein n=1 Tax=Arenibacter sp. M-2 TaxID=3053612 RepID=UPI0025709E7D|nr:prepilin-type N-terminal cleavage/methylation domain-containing protein [Arenibacter sp. M-2]MDL5514848.1 prepilin-type N-terminal cleavage/methylation domain-containing protein [Arenibacter sp. M-2]